MAESPNHEFRPPNAGDSELLTLQLNLPSLEDLERYVQSHRDILKMLKEEITRLKQNFIGLRETLMEVKLQMLSLDD